MPMLPIPNDAEAGAAPGGGRRPTVMAAPASASAELSGRPRRRTFTATDKARILAATDRAVETGDVSAFLRREGVYSSTLCDWRRQRDAGTLGALTPARRGPKALEANPLTAKVALLEKNNAHLTRSLARAEAIIVVQKNLCGRLPRWQALRTLPKRLVPSRPGAPDSTIRRRHVSQLLGSCPRSSPVAAKRGVEDAGLEVGHEPRDYQDSRLVLSGGP